MPKPVLSDSLFNADDVATAVLAEANLQVANSNLGVTDIGSHFTVGAGWAGQYQKFLYFNGFVFWAGYYFHSGGAPSGGETFLTIDNADYRPSVLWRLPAHGYQGDSGSRIEVNTNGDIKIMDPYNVGSATFYLTVSHFWNVNF